MCFKMETDKIYNMDCIEGMKQIPDASVDTIITDPPFMISREAIKEVVQRIKVHMESKM